MVGSISKQGDIVGLRTGGAEVNLVDAIAKLVNIKTGTPMIVKEATANNSNKTLTVPANEAWILRSIYAEIVCTAVVGNRVLACKIKDPSDGVLMVEATANIAASQKGNLLMVPNMNRATTNLRMLDATLANISVAAALPFSTVLLPGYKIQLLDMGAIDAAADDLTYVVQYMKVNSEDYV